MSPYEAYELARKYFKGQGFGMLLGYRSDMVATHALRVLGLTYDEINKLLITYVGGKTRDRVVAAYEHHINRTMSIERKAAMKYQACSTCKNEPYQAGVGGPCATCGVLVETSTGREAGTPANWYPKLDAEFAKAQAPIERALATHVSHVTVERPLTRKVLGFLNDLCHPDQFGYAVTKEVRQRARQLAAEVEAEDSIP